MTPDKAAYAASHPLRLAIWKELAKREASPLELAAKFGSDLGTTAYHVRILDREGAIYQTRTRPVRGATAHYYRAAYSIRLEVKPLKRKENA